MGNKAEEGKIADDTLFACKKFGAFAVRKAAIRQMRGDNQALEEVGLESYGKNRDSLFLISTRAFWLLTAEELREDNDFHFGEDFPPPGWYK